MGVRVGVGREGMGRVGVLVGRWDRLLALVAGWVGVLSRRRFWRAGIRDHGFSARCRCQRMANDPGFATWSLAGEGQEVPQRERQKREARIPLPSPNFEK